MHVVANYRAHDCISTLQRVLYKQQTWGFAIQAVIWKGCTAFTSLLNAIFAIILVLLTPNSPFFKESAQTNDLPSKRKKEKWVHLLAKLLRGSIRKTVFFVTMVSIFFFRSRAKTYLSMSSIGAPSAYSLTYSFSLNNVPDVC
jgi:hypothetical protein